jgi:hypothetical protein
MSTPPINPSQRIPVSVDRDLEDIVPIFLANRNKDVHTLRASIANQDLETVGILGHRMKGDGGGYGFDMISQIGGAIELAVGRRDHPAIERLTAQLEDFLARVTVIYR